MIPRSLALLVLWIALWGELSVANVLTGIAVVALVSWMFAERTHATYQVRPLNAIRLVSFVAWGLVTSSARVVWAVLFPTPERTITSVQRVRLERGSVFVGAIVANAITLTPGTMTLELDAETLELQVHVLGTVEPEQFHADVLDLERRVAAAVRERSWT
jgi:multicomponent Na+:H+ antiporter subunit E